MDEVVSGVGVEAVEYHQETATVRTRLNQEKTSASVAGIATLAEVMDADPVEMDPLDSSVYPGALDTHVRPRNGTNGDSHVTLSHEGHASTVHSYGDVTITPGHDSSAETNERSAGR